MALDTVNHNILISVVVRMNSMIYKIFIYIWLSYVCIDSYLFISSK